MGLRSTEKKIVLENDCWSGTGAIILRGITIGNGAVVGAGSLVTKDVPTYSIVAGNSAKIIRKRFDVETISKLEKSQWWMNSPTTAKNILGNIRG